MNSDIIRRRKKKKILAILLIISLYKYNCAAQRSVWVHPFIARRKEQGLHANLFMELRDENPEKYRRCLRITPEMFDWLVEKVRPLIQRQDTQLRRCIGVEERLSVCLRHLATGESQESLAVQYRLGQSTISGIIKETCKALHLVLKDTYLKFPSSSEEWKNISNEFGERWNFHNCIGAKHITVLDGKHILISPPIKSGSLYYNYKDTFSIVLLAVVDANLRFIYVDVGTNGRISDKGVWNKCSLKAHLEEDNLGIPSPFPLPGTQEPFPYVIVANEGFTLTKRVLIPFSKEQVTRRKARRIFNYRLSRSRRCSENAFGVMGNRFQILRAPMRYDPDDARDIVLAILCLHNLLRSDSIGRALYTPASMLDSEDEISGQIHRGEWRENQGFGFMPLGHQGGNRHAAGALQLREKWTDYFNTVGAVPWQDSMV